jgi:hypothetical protein
VDGPGPVRETAGLRSPPPGRAGRSPARGVTLQGHDHDNAGSGHEPVARAADRTSSAARPPANAAHRRLLALQRSLGNAATARLLAGDGPAIQRAIAVTTADTNYTVSGETLNDVATEVQGRPEAGSVTPSWAPNPPTYVANTKGVVTGVTTTFTETKQMPTWTKAATACPPVKAAWDKFYGALDAHENNHIAKDKAEFTTLERKLVGTPEDKVDAIFDAAVERANTTNATYDTTSDHGRNEGVNINTAAQCAPEKVKSTAAEGDTGDEATV